MEPKQDKRTMTLVGLVIVGIAAVILSVFLINRSEHKQSADDDNDFFILACAHMDCGNDSNLQAEKRENSGINTEEVGCPAPWTINRRNLCFFNSLSGVR